MTANEAIKILEVAKAECEWNAPLDYQEAFDLAISALQAQDSKTRRICDTCKHNPVSKKWPCVDCDMREPADRWEPQEVNNSTQEAKNLTQNALDTISRTAAIDAIKTSRFLVDAMEKVIKLPSAQPEQRWIPCSERLPYTNGIYIVTRRISDGFECLNITDACYFDGSNTWHDDTRVNHERKYLADVLAWMPLPESYRAERRTDE